MVATVRAPSTAIVLSVLLVELPDWRSRGDAVIAVGQAVRIALRRGAEGGTYRVASVIDREG